VYKDRYEGAQQCVIGGATTHPSEHIQLTKARIFSKSVINYCWRKSTPIHFYPYFGDFGCKSTTFKNRFEPFTPLIDGV
jgi:hypothetical protein